MEIKPNIPHIRHRFESAVYNRGSGYYQSGRVLEVCGEFPDYSFTVKGSDNHKYRGFFRLDENGDLARADCDCPYPHNCKHLAAALLYLNGHDLSREDGAALSRDLQEYRLQAEQQTPRLVKLGDSHPSRNRRLAERIRARSSQVRPYSLGWELLIDRSHSFDKKIILTPCLVHQPQDGSPGRREDFREDRLNVLPPPADLDLLEFCLRHPLRRLLLLSNLPALLGVLNPDRSFFYRNTTLSLHPVQGAQVHFEIYRDTHRQMSFRPVIRYLTAQGLSRPFTAWHLQQEVSQDTYLALDENAGLFYYRSGLSDLQEWSALLSLPLLMQYHQIGEWLQVLPEKTSRVQVTLPSPEVRVLKSLPAVRLKVSEALYNKGVEVLLEFNYSPSSDPDLLLDPDPEYELRVMRFLEKIFRPAAAPKSWQGETTSKWELRLGILDFVLQYGTALLDQGFEITLPRGYRKVQAWQGRINLQARSLPDWFEFSLDLGETAGEGYDLSLLDKGMIQTRQEFLVLSATDLDRLQIWKKWGLDNKGRIRTHRADLQRIDGLLRDGAAVLADGRELQERYRRLLDMGSWPLYPAVHGFTGHLRAYQELGVRWLLLLWEEKLGGILADDMGLGKTVQTLYFLEALREQGLLQRVLLVVPVTTLPNWEAESARFVPGLGRVCYHGPRRRQLNWEGASMVLTSYNTLARDLEHFSSLEWDCVILDEAQNIKNAASQAFKAVCSLKARFRLSLTGTPVENHTRELWAHMDFLFPGLLGNLKEFTRDFARPIEEGHDQETLRCLQIRCAPFILRRKKQQVLQDLPEKEEIILYCDMETTQARLYRDTARQLRQKVKSELDAKGIKKSAVPVFEALLKLRQVCLFPGLLDAGLEAVGSVKEAVLLETMQELQAEGHRTLVFSQFVKVLDRIQPLCEGHHWSWVRLDGRTRNRQQPVERFQEEQVDFFLVSLRAGGTGINLTAADYVILFDPWWNPAVETQAVDRAHRIGQKNRVTVYRLIVRGTVEEKILALQERKKALVEDILSADSAFYSSLSAEEILDLF